MFRLIPLKNLPSLIILLLLGQNLNAQEMVIKASLDSCPDAPSIYQFDGVTFTNVYPTISTPDKNRYDYSFTIHQPSFYYIGTPPSDLKLFLIDGSEENISLNGDCNNLKELKVENAPLNEQFTKVRAQQLNLNIEAGRTKALIQKSTADSNKIECYAKLSQINNKKLELYQQSRISNPLIGEIVALGTYIDYLPNKSPYKDEINHFINEFFRNANLNALQLPNNPFLYEAFKNYTNTILQIRVPRDLTNTIFSDLLNQLPPMAAVRSMAYGGIVSTLEQKKHPDFLKYADSLITILEQTNTGSISILNNRIAQATQFSPGGTPPEFQQQNPTGTTLKLSDFKGQYLLLDFWASWCGPCRRENPNVVRLYQKYHEKGFEILGISLDNNKKRWLNAIEKDGLNWPQVSDLKGWSNEVAQQYQVTSIPKTFLLDPNGKIVSVNLRGQALAEKLAELFPE